MKAVIMAGGEGSRLRPITANRPKPLAPICNKPIMEHILTLLKRHGFSEVVVTTHYLSDEIESYFGDGEDFGVSMHYSLEDTPLGTAGSVKKAEAHLQDGPFLIISGDALTDCDLQEAIRFHQEKGSVATLVLYRVPNPLDFGVVITEDDGKIVRFLEKPSWSEVFSDTVNTGMYILDPEVFAMMQSGKNYDWSQDIFPKLLRDGRPMYGYVMEGYWADVGSLTQYREAQEEMLDRKVNLPVDVPEVEPGIYMDDNCTIEPGAKLLPPVCLGRNCKIKEGATIGPYTVMGDNVLVEANAVVEKSVVWDSTYIGRSSNVMGAILGTRVTIKRDVMIHEDAVVGDRCLIDAGCVIRPQIKLWPDKIIERGSTVTMSLIWGSKWRGNLFRELGVAGLSNIEMTPDFACRLGSAFGSCLPPKSKVVTSRDSTRSSRMIKRALISALLSAGCNVLDLRSTSVPVSRHFIKTSGAAGAMHVRKLPGNARVSLIEMYDSQGGYLSKKLERKVETAFFREDFYRIDAEDLGVIEFASRASEEYIADYERLLDYSTTRKRVRVVCDYGYSSLASLMPTVLSHLGADSISLNALNDAKLAPRTQEEEAKHVENLRHIVGTLGYDLGVLFLEEGERLIVVDNLGNTLSGDVLLGAMATLIAQTEPETTIAISVAASARLEERLHSLGAKVLRTKNDARALMDSTLNDGAMFAGDSRGGFIFPQIHPGFDAMFSLGKLIKLLQAVDSGLSDVVLGLPPFPIAHDQVRCAYDVKGMVMRKITDYYKSAERIELVDGIKVYEDGGWVLIHPDSFEPVFHVVAEGRDDEHSRTLVRRFSAQIEQFQVE